MAINTLTRPRAFETLLTSWVRRRLDPISILGESEKIPLDELRCRLGYPGLTSEDSKDWACAIVRAHYGWFLGVRTIFGVLYMVTLWVLVSVCISVIEPTNKIGAWLILGILVAYLISDFFDALACRLLRRRLR